MEKLVWNADEKTFSSPDGTTRLELIADPLGLREEQLLGEYALSYTGKKTDVSISKQPNGGILMKGLPFDVRLTYNSKKGALELNSQQLKTSPDIRLAIWCSQLGNLTWGTGYGLTTRWNGDDETLSLSWWIMDMNGLSGAKGSMPMLLYCGIRQVENTRGMVIPVFRI